MAPRRDKPANSCMLSSAPTTVFIRLDKIRITSNVVNMKAVFVLAVLLCALALTLGDLVCGTNYCKQHPCTNSLARSSCRTPSVYRASHAGKCACCPACVTFLDEGRPCKTYSKELGETPSAICREPLKCLTGVCTKVPPRG
ncbi:unnamed protein product, partial [Iphiclides podalirius]